VGQQALQVETSAHAVPPHSVTELGDEEVGGDEEELTDAMTLEDFTGERGIRFGKKPLVGHEPTSPSTQFCAFIW
jgi:hypothetical protein